jgi:cytochrome c peroxidase
MFAQYTGLRPIVIRRLLFFAMLLCIVTILTSLGRQKPNGFDLAQTSYQWQLPAGFEPVPEGPDGPLLAARVELGRHLFYDKRISANGSQSCASCHQPQRAFSDGLPQAIGSTGEQHAHNTPSLFNSGYLKQFGWQAPQRTSIEAQVNEALFGTNPVELGISGSEEEVLARFSGDPLYQTLFARAFPQSKQMDWPSLGSALADFSRSLISGDSAYDRYLYQNDSQALTPSAERGMRLFFSNELACAHCHSDLQAPERAQAPSFLGLSYQDTGMAERGFFRVPPLRNVALTAPYMHNGSLASLDEVIRFYEQGGAEGANRPEQNRLVSGFILSDQERHDLIAFLEALSDQQALQNERYSDPFR